MVQGKVDKADGLPAKQTAIEMSELSSAVAVAPTVKEEGDKVKTERT